MKSAVSTAALCLSIVGAAAILVAGPLNPPAGPVASSYKTLSEVEPRTAITAANTQGDADSLFKITQPGSYYLTGNITGAIGKHGIEVTASGVTLDLNGFDLVGVSGMGAFDAVSVTTISLTDIAVINGSVRNWGGDGIDLATAFTSNTRVTDVCASGNAGAGISVNSNAVVSECAAFRNAGAGISLARNGSVAHSTSRENGGLGIGTGQGSVVVDCGTFLNGGAGILVGIASTVSDCTARQNSVVGIDAGEACTISGCSAWINTLDGIRVTSDCIVRGNTCASNGFQAGDGAGIHATSNDNRIEGNNCTDADRGIHVDTAGNIIIQNTCSGNTTNWVIAANNVCGPILDRTAPASALINGNSAPDSTGSTHPNANFTY